jgi:hypothetical protein
MHKIDHINAVNQTAVVEPHAKNLEACAAVMESAGIGCAADHGHVAILRRMAASLRADAALGKLPHVFRDSDRLYASSAEPAPLNSTTKSILTQIGL